MSQIAKKTDRPLLRLEGIVKSFDSPNGEAPRKVLCGVDLTLAQGESVAILGPSGSGKSTLLSIIGTLEPATDGCVSWDGRSLERLDEEELAHHRNRQIGFVFQKHHLMPQCSALENVLLPTLASKQKRDRKADLRRANELLERVDLSHRKDNKPAQLSGGECQRVAVVRALIQSPRLLLADEPTGSLDAASASHLIDLLVELQSSDELSLILVTHSTALAERMDRVFELCAGRLVERSKTESDA
ncbi:MAG: ABC-type lipoprotein export system ATPase subunit [Planctomycetota bacterium]|jgi:ABC-type lipoprotein export system ATPase subunit